MKVIENIVVCLIMGLFLFGVVWVLVLINTWQKDNCINNGGMSVDNGFGYFEKCIYGGEE